MDFETFVIVTNEAETPDDVYALFIQAMQRFGFDRSVYSFLTRHASVGFEAGHAIACAYPDDWMEHYFARQYQRIDPVIGEALRSSRPFLWDTLPMDADQQRLMDESKELRLFDGVGIPMHSANGEVAAIGVASSERMGDIAPHQMSLLHAYAFQFHHAYTAKLAAEETPRIALTPKESEVLHWMAEGKTLNDIAEIMHLSEDTIRYYLKAIYRKLGVNQRTQAVIKGIRYGLLNPYRIGL